MQWDYIDVDGGDRLTVMRHDDNTWSVLFEFQTGETSEFTDLPDANMRDLYEHLKRHYES